MTALGTRLSLDDETWLQPIADDQALGPDAEYVIALIERYVAFADGEVARTGVEPGDELELYESMVRITPEDLELRPAKVGSQRDAWARRLVRDVIDPQVRHLRISSVQVSDAPARLFGNAG